MRGRTDGIGAQVTEIEDSISPTIFTFPIMHPSKPEACFSARTGLTGVRFMTISDVPSIITITLLMTIGKGVVGPAQHAAPLQGTGGATNRSGACAAPAR